MRTFEDYLRQLAGANTHAEPVDLGAVLKVNEYGVGLHFYDAVFYVKGDVVKSTLYPPPVGEVPAQGGGR